MREMFRTTGIVCVALSLLFAPTAVGWPHSRLIYTGLSDHNRIPKAALEILEHADQFDLLSLDPLPRTPAKNTFHGRKVLDRISVKDPEARRRLISALKMGPEENQGNIAMCFNPRHGIHVVHEGKQADFVICFECLQVEVYGVGKGRFLVSDSPKAIFDKELQAAPAPLN